MQVPGQRHCFQVCFFGLNDGFTLRVDGHNHVRLAAKVGVYFPFEHGFEILHREAALIWIMVTAVVNTEGVSRGVRLAVFALLFLLVLYFVVRGDPRLKEAVTPQRRISRGVA